MQITIKVILTFIIIGLAYYIIIIGLLAYYKIELSENKGIVNLKNCFYYLNFYLRTSLITIKEFILIIIILTFIIIGIAYYIFTLSNTPPDTGQNRVPKPEESVIPPLNPDLYNIPALEADYHKKQEAVKNQKAEIKSAKKQISDLKSGISSAKQTLKDQKLKADKARTALKQVQKRVLENPELSSEQERFAYHQAQIVVEEKNNALNQLVRRLAQAEKNVKEEQVKLGNIESELNKLTKKLKIGYVAHFKAKAEREKKIDGYGEAGCNDERSIKECKEAALQAALKNVSSKGSIIFVNAETLSILDKGEWKLTKDEIRTQSRAIVIGHEVLEEGPLGKIAAYHYKIRATVKGQIPLELQRQLLEP